MTAADIRLRFGPYCPVILSDATYATPTLAYLTGPFFRFFWNQRTNAGLMKWERKNDCDNFARAYAQCAADAHALTTAGTSEGLAVGEFDHHKAGAGPHAIIVAFTDAGQVFIEPQNGKQITLTPDEIASCFHVRF